MIAGKNIGRIIDGKSLRVFLEDIKHRVEGQRIGYPLAAVNMAAFKESGAIEYSSDVLMGLQYEGMDYSEGETDGNGDLF